MVPVMEKAVMLYGWEGNRIRYSVALAMRLTPLTGFVAQ